MVIILGGGEEMCRTFVNEGEMFFFFFLFDFGCALSVSLV